MKVTQPQPKFFPLRFFLITLSFFFSALALANTPIDTLRIRSALLKNIPPTTLIAQDDTYTVTTSSERQYVGSVFDNDRWGTTTPTDETVRLFAVSGTTDSNGDKVLRTATKGRILIPAHTPVGTYKLLYQICEQKLRKHCQTATVTVIVLPKVVSPTTKTPTTTTGTTQTTTTVTPTTQTPTVSSPTLIAQDDTYTVTTSSEKQYVGSVFDNDRWGTTTPTDETVRLFAVSGTKDSNGDKVLRTATKGRILIPAHTPVGTYKLLYQICEQKLRKHCQTATVTVIVLPKVVSPTTKTPTTTTGTTQTTTTVTPTTQTPTVSSPTLIAQDDTYTVTTSSEKQYVGSVFDNDRWGTTTPTDETVGLFAVSGTTDNKGDLVLRTASKGRILVPAHTPVGTYELLYQICEQKLRKHCQTATVTVIVLPKTVSPTTKTPTTTDTTQTPTVSSPTTQTNTTVTPTTLIAQDDTYTVTTSSEKQYVGSVFDNDRWGTITPTDETVGLFAVSGTTDNKGDLVLRTASKGRILVPAHTPAGTYELLYQICEQKLRKHCQTATVTVIVLPKTVSPTTQTNTTTTSTTQTPTVSSPTTLIAQDDTYTVTTSSEKQYVGSVFDNDRWGTNTPTDETVRLFVVSGTTDSNGDKVLRTASEGRVLVPAHTPVGSYKLLYRTCDRKDHTLCQTATVTVIVLPKTVSPTTQTNTTTTSTTQTNTTVTPTTLIAQDDTYTVTTSSEKQYVGSVFDNDRWSTTTPTDETVRLFAVSGTTDSNGDLVLRTATKGRVLVPAHTPVGTYKLLYQICEQKLRKHCQTASVTVIVLPKVVSPTTQTPTTTTGTTQTPTTVTPTAQTNTTVTPTTLIAQDDTYTITTSLEKQYVGSVFDNDRWGTTTPTDETVGLFAVSGTTDSNGDLVLRTASKGRILVPAHTPVGTYQLLYRICDRKIRKHCQTATVTVIVLSKTVSPMTTTRTTQTPTTQTPTTSTPTTQTPTTATPTTLIAQDDTYTITTSSEKQYVGSVFDNDRWGTTTPTDETVSLFAVSGTTDSNGDLVLRTASEGRVLVPAHTPVGTYKLLYRICDPKIHKHCQTATVTVIVLPKTVSPTTQTPTTTTSTTQTPTTVTPTTQTNTTVTPTTLIAQDDTYTVTTSSEKQYVGSVFDNDRWGTTTPTDETVRLFAVSGTTDNKGDLVLRTASKGRILVPAHTPVGTYELLYRICDPKNHKYCQTATVTVIVLPKVVSPTTQTPTTTTSTTQTNTTVTPTTQTNTTVTPTTQTNTTVTPTTLIAQDDTYTITTSSEKQYVGSVFDNDRWGTTTPTDETVGLFAVSGTTDSNGDLVLRTASKGRILVPAHTPVGTYQLLYRICEQKLRKHCQTATVTVIVLPKVVSPSTQTPTTTTSTTQTPTTVTPTAQTNTTVTPTTLITQDDTYTITTSSEKQYVGSVFDNDRWGTITPTDETVRLLAVSGTTDNKGDLVLRTTSKGRILVPAHTPAGTYELLYRICDRKFHKHCQTATVTVIVLPKTVSPTTQTPTTTTSTTQTPTTQTPTTATPTTLIAQDDTYTVTTSLEKQYVGSVFDNDRWGTTTPTDETVGLFAISGTTDNKGDLVLRTTSKGRILVPAHTPVGTYQLLYRICDRKDHTLCQTASVTVIVLPKTVSPTTQTSTTTTSTTQTNTTATPTTQTNTTVTPTTLIAEDDTYTVTTSLEKQYVGSVFDNDRWGTTTPTDETVGLFAISGTTDNKGDLVLRTTSKGRILVPAHTPVGTYQLLYRICEQKLRKHCQTATVTVIVLPKVVSPTIQTPTTTTGTTQTNTTVTPTTQTNTTITPTTLIAQDDTYTITASSEKQYVGSVFDNDRWGTTTPTNETVGLFAISGTTDNNGDLVLRTASEGRILVPAHTPVGSYQLLYRICDRKDHTLCQTASVTVIVLPKVVSPTTQTPTTTTSTTQTNTTQTPTTSTPTTLIAQDDTYTVTTSSEKQYVGSVFDNDRWGTTTPTDETVGLFAVSGTTDSKGGLVLKTASEGRILIPAYTPVGTYQLLYRICDRKDHTLCQTASVTVIVLPKVVSPTTQTPTTTTSTTQTNTTVTPTTQTNTTQTETSQEPIAVPDNVSTTMNITIRIPILNNDTPYNAIPVIISIPLKGTAVVNEDNTISYEPNTNFIGIDSFVYKLCGLSPKQCSSATVTIKVTHKIEIYNGISANNDSKNDYLHILGIEIYPNNKVVIFSKDAEKVFECTHYDNVTNVFRGNYKESTKTLPSNTYFYFIEYEDEELQTKKLKGWLYLKH